MGHERVSMAGTGGCVVAEESLWLKIRVGGGCAGRTEGLRRAGTESGHDAENGRLDEGR